ncbi:MAG: hypothetical protein KF745_10990 [Phycisphaeraceae bacterium]|nr:hypothetical protein [Phycisphaeraceae bacterium]
MSKKNTRRMFGAALGITVGAFLVDRLFLGGGAGPESAAASPVEAIQVGAKPSDKPEISPRVDSAAALASKLREIAASTESPTVRDAFRLGKAASKTDNNEGPLTALDDKAAAAFTSKYTLRGVIEFDGSPIAVIGDRHYKVGDVLDEFTLVSASIPTRNDPTAAAVFESENTRITLHVPLQKASRP